MDEEQAKIYKPKHYKLLVWEWRVLIMIVIAMFLWLAIKLFILSGLTIDNILLLGFISIILIFDMIFLHDLLTDIHLTVTRQEIIFHNMFGKLRFLWGNAKSIDKGFLGQYLKFAGKPIFQRNAKWAWLMMPTWWPAFWSTRRLNAILLRSWERPEELMQDIKLYAPQVFATGNPPK